MDVQMVDSHSVAAVAHGSDHLPWVEKYRPSSLDEVVAHEDIVRTIQRLLSADKLPHLLFYGPPGTGKTSTILAIARQIFKGGLQKYVLHLNASDDRGINVVRGVIKEFASTRLMFSSGFKLIILDEADAMTNEAQAALRRVMEKYTKNVRFCLICNYVNKIIPALQSRCTRFRFAPLKRSQMIARIENIISAEHLQVASNGVDAIIKLGTGDMRKVVNILQSAAMSTTGLIDETSIYNTTGKPHPEDIRELITTLLNYTIEDAFRKIRELTVTKGLALTDLISEISAYVLRIEFPEPMKMFLIQQLADTEYRLSISTQDRVQLGGVIGAFAHAKEKYLGNKSS